MPLVIAGGPSVTDYPKQDLSILATHAFTFAVNSVCFDFPCDVVVSIDPCMIVKQAKKLKELGKPILTRHWRFPETIDLDIIRLPKEIDDEIVKRFPLSGMLACKVSDMLAGIAASRKSYVIGMDASQGHYKGHPEKQDHITYLDEKRPLSKYHDLNLTNTINLSVKSNIDAWPKKSKLPKVGELMVHEGYKKMALLWLRERAIKEVI